MEGTDRDEATRLLQNAGSDAGANLDRLVPVVYEQLRSIAARQLARERPDHTLQTTALVHEAYLKLIDDARVTRRGRAYFFAAAARAMRQVLVDHARRRTAAKRGGGVEPASLSGVQAPGDTFAAEILDLDAALGRLAALNPRHARVVECRFFGGLTFEEIAEALGLSLRTVKYDWALARAWLYDALRGQDRPVQRPHDSERRS